jgi:hypothetical protein
MLEGAQAAVETIGHGARLRQLTLEPIPFDMAAPSLRHRAFRIEMDLLGDHLERRPERFIAIHPVDLSLGLETFWKTQAGRASALDRRALYPGKIEVETIALHLLLLTGQEVCDVAACEPGYCIPGPSPLMVNGAELTDVSFFLADGEVSTRFDFAGGYFHTSAVILHDTYPAALQESLVGKFLNQVISGGVFEIVSPRIAGLGNMTQGTYLELERTTEWADWNR